MTTRLDRDVSVGRSEGPGDARAGRRSLRRRASARRRSAGRLGARAGRGAPTRTSRRRRPGPRADSRRARPCGSRAGPPTPTTRYGRADRERARRIRLEHVGHDLIGGAAGALEDERRSPLVAFLASATSRPVDGHEPALGRLAEAGRTDGDRRRAACRSRRRASRLRPGGSRVGRTVGQRPA